MPSIALLHDSEQGGWTDQYGSRWNYSTDEATEPQVCDHCGKEIYDGWYCLDGGYVLCEDHPVIVPEWMHKQLRAEFHERIDHHNRLVEMRCRVGQATIDLLRESGHEVGKYFGWVVPTESAHRLIST